VLLTILEGSPFWQVVRVEVQLSSQVLVGLVSLGYERTHKIFDLLEWVCKTSMNVHAYKNSYKDNCSKLDTTAYNIALLSNSFFLFFVLFCTLMELTCFPHTWFLCVKVAPGSYAIHGPIRSIHSHVCRSILFICQEFRPFYILYCPGYISGWVGYIMHKSLPVAYTRTQPLKDLSHTTCLV